MSGRAPCGGALLLAAFAFALQAAPNIGFVYPGGGQQGTTFEVTVGGQDLAGTKVAMVTGDGVRTKVLRHATPLSERNFMAARQSIQDMNQFASAGRQAMQEGEGGQATYMHMRAMRARETLAMRAAKLGIDDATPRGFARYQRIYNDPRRQPNAQLAETVTIEITIASDAEPGLRELRLETPGGATNPVYLQVGQAREYREQEPNDRKPDHNVLASVIEGMLLEDLEPLPVVINGQIKPGDVDRFRFLVPGGTNLVATVSARRLVPYLADAVPGWFQATLTLYDPEGMEVAYSDDFRFDPDPAICYQVPKSGTYVLEIRDAIYRGREDFVYRIDVGELPYLTSIFPLGGPAGRTSKLEVDGWNLASKTMTAGGPKQAPGIQQVSVSKDGWISNTRPFAVDELPERLEHEPNDDASQPEALSLPIIVNGRIDRPGDWDVFRIEGPPGSEIRAEVAARRLQSPLDSLLKVTDSAGFLLAANDDFVDKTGHLHRGPGLITHHADSQLSVKLPADGVCLLYLGDTRRHGSPAHAYRLRVSHPRPDFALRVVPSSICASGGTVVPIVVHALRQDGFAGEISLHVTAPKDAFSLSGARIPPGEDQVRLTLSLPNLPRTRTLELQLEGRATIDGKPVRHPAVPAEDTMQAFLWRHLVPTTQCLATVIGGSRSRPARVLSEGPVTLKQGGESEVQLALPGANQRGKIIIELVDPPAGLAVKAASADGDQTTITFSADAEGPSPMQGNIIAEAFLETARQGADGEPLPPQRTSLGMLPAIAYTVHTGQE
jgi:hypothetical protein